MSADLFGDTITMNSKIDSIKKKILAKMDTRSSFADPEVQSRQLKDMFKYSDSSGNGTLSFDEFVAAMVRLNFVGVPKEMEALFKAFDKDGSGVIDYREMSDTIFGVGPPVKALPDLGPVIERVRAVLRKRGAANGIRSATAILRRLDDNGSRGLEKEELRDGLAVVGVPLSPKELIEVMAYFDRDGSGTVSVTEFLEAVRGSNFTPRRAAIVNVAWSRLETEGDGVVTLDDLATKYDVSDDPEVIAGTKTAREVLHDFAACWDKSGDDKITKAEFLEYYRDMSVNIEDEDYFELMVRNAWHISGGEGAAANTSDLRVLVIHSDGSQEVVECKDDLGLDPHNTEQIIKFLHAQGVEDIAHVDTAGGC